MASIYHEGELWVQAQVGVATMASRVARVIRDFLPDGFGDFLAERRLLVVAFTDEHRRIWASPLMGEPGFVHEVDEQTVYIEALPNADDPLYAHLAPGLFVGLIAIEFATRERVRLNGRVEYVFEKGFYVRAQQVYGNCPKFITPREIVSSVPLNNALESPVSPLSRASSLSHAQQVWIGGADTFFIASSSKQENTSPLALDASHRGGAPGFVQVVDANTLRWPDYAGNAMFNTLGNLAVNPHAGLLFIHFERGDILHLTGQATILWNTPAPASTPEKRDATLLENGRAVEFRIDQVVERKAALPFRFVRVDER